jgi:hypothetical protein
MDVDSNFDDALRAGEDALEAFRSNNEAEVDGRLLEGVLSQTYATTLRLCQEGRGLEESGSMWYKMGLFCERVKNAARGFGASTDSETLSPLLSKAEDLRTICHVRWKNIQSEMALQGWRDSLR